MSRFHIIASAVLAGSLAWANPADAALVENLDDIAFWVGSGASRSALVIDWADGRDPLAWGYRWNGTATAEDLLRAVDLADPRLTVVLEAFGPDFFVNAAGYDRDGDGFTPSDPQDSYRESGDFITDFRFWEYLTAPDSPYDGSATWASENLGISDRVLADGLWNGFRFDDAFPGPGPAQPMAAVAPAAVPEPSSLLLLAGSMLAGGAVYRIRRRWLAE